MDFLDVDVDRVPVSPWVCSRCTTNNLLARVCGMCRHPAPASAFDPHSTSPPPDVPPPPPTAEQLIRLGVETGSYASSFFSLERNRYAFEGVQKFAIDDERGEEGKEEETKAEETKEEEVHGSLLVDLGVKLNGSRASRYLSALRNRPVFEAMQRFANDEKRLTTRTEETMEVLELANAVDGSDCECCMPYCLHEQVDDKLQPPSTASSVRLEQIQNEMQQARIANGDFGRTKMRVLMAERNALMLHERNESHSQVAAPATGVRKQATSTVVDLDDGDDGAMFDVVDAVGDDGDNLWECKTCTFNENPADALACTVCGDAADATNSVLSIECAGEGGPHDDCLESHPSYANPLAEHAAAVPVQSEMGVLRLSCGHCFHPGCLSGWVREQIRDYSHRRTFSCPSCRHQIRHPGDGENESHPPPSAGYTWHTSGIRNLFSHSPPSAGLSSGSAALMFEIESGQSRTVEFASSTPFRGVSRSSHLSYFTRFLRQAELDLHQLEELLNLDPDLEPPPSPLQEAYEQDLRQAELDPHSFARNLFLREAAGMELYASAGRNSYANSLLTTRAADQTAAQLREQLHGQQSTRRRQEYLERRARSGAMQEEQRQQHLRQQRRRR
jgi:hypothetical protein